MKHKLDKENEKELIEIELPKSGFSKEARSENWETICCTVFCENEN